MSTETTKFDLYQVVTDRIIGLLEGGTVPWRKPWSSSGPPMNAVTKHAYQGINLWMLHILPYASNLYLTFEQLKKIGGSVNRGEKGHIIVYWHAKENPESEQDQKNEQPRNRFVLRYHKVFNVEQCSGISSSVTASNYEQQLDPIKACDAIVINMPNKPQIKFGKNHAFYCVPGDYINIPKMKSFESSEAYYATLFHEMIHSTGHEKRLDRKTVTDMCEFGSEPYSMEELIAEIGSCHLANHAGTMEHTIQNNAAYINGWLTKLKGDKRFIIQASSNAQRAVDLILDIKKSEDSQKNNIEN